MGHITISGQSLRPRTPGLFWVTFTPLARRVTLHLGETPGGRSLFQRESGSRWWRKMLCEESHMLMMTSSQGQAWCPGSGGTSVAVLCKDTLFRPVIFVTFCDHQRPPLACNHDRPVSTLGRPLDAGTLPHPYTAWPRTQTWPLAAAWAGTPPCLRCWGRLLISDCSSPPTHLQVCLPS